MIHALTKEQEAALPFYRDTWLAYGLQTTTDRAAAEAAVDRLYLAAGKAAPRLKIWCESPLACALAVAIIARLPEFAARVIGENASSAVDSAVGSAVRSAVGSAVDSAVGSAVGSAVRSAVDSAVRSAVDSAVGSAVDSAVGSAVRSAVDSAVDSAVGSAVGSAVRSAVGSAVRSAVGSAVRSAVDSAVDSAVRLTDWYNACWGYYWWKEGWGGYVAYMRDVLAVQVGDAGNAIADVGRDCGWFWLFEHAVFLSDRPVEIHTNARGQSHKDGGLAVKFGDGWGVACLNGVIVPRDVAMLPAAELPASLVVKEKNAEIRRELIRKIGVPRVMKELGAKLVDSRWGYELVKLDLGDGRYRPYLKMQNPSIDETHVEGVHPDCQTVEQALNWRNGFDVSKPFTAPLVLT